MPGALIGGQPPAEAGLACPSAVTRQGHASLVVYSSTEMHVSSRENTWFVAAESVTRNSPKRLDSLGISGTFGAASFEA